MSIMGKKNPLLIAAIMGDGGASQKGDGRWWFRAEDLRSLVSLFPYCYYILFTLQRSERRFIVHILHT